jgi:hypothetical protein
MPALRQGIVSVRLWAEGGSQSGIEDEGESEKAPGEWRSSSDTI